MRSAGCTGRRGCRSKACQAGHRVAFATAAQWVDRLAAAHHGGPVLRRTDQDSVAWPLLISDEVGYIPFGTRSRQLVLPAHLGPLRAGASLIVISNKPFGRWREVFGDDVVAAAMIDRLVHHAEVLSMKGDSYRLKDRDLGRVPAAIKQP